MSNDLTRAYPVRAFSLPQAPEGHPPVAHGATANAEQAVSSADR